MQPEKTRQTLIRKIADHGNEEAWTEFISNYEDYLKRVLSRYGLNEAELHDTLQNTLLKLWEKLPTFKYDPQKGQFRSWLATVAINNMRTTVRKEIKQRESISEGLNLNSEQESLEETLEKEWRIFIAEKAWQNLKPYLNKTMRETFSLHLEGLNSTEISKELNIATSSVRVYKQRVTYKLKYEISRLENELN